MKTQIISLVASAIEKLKTQGVLGADLSVDIGLERTRDDAHGDFACNIAMKLAKPAQMKPRDLAEKIVKALPASPMVTKVEIAGPGFINFYMASGARQSVIDEVLSKGRNYGRSQKGKGQRVQVEFVSANPTGPLHVGHGRGAAYGAVVANLLSAVGFNVHKEYYINDAGRQMDILAASVWLRYLEFCGETFRFPSNGYRGEYVKDISRELWQKHGKDFHHKSAVVFADLPQDLTEENPQGDKEAYIDAVVERAKHLLGKQAYHVVFGAGLNSILTDIREDLAEFGVVYDEWFSERSLIDSNAVQRAVDMVRKKGYLFEKDGATWFRSTDFGDVKDRVVVRENGQATYFASDIAYHMNKYERGFDKIVNIWGADHHGYIPRVKAAITAMGFNADALDVSLVQFAILYRGEDRVQMSTRSGEFVTLRELREEVSNDAARFFYIMRKSDAHLDFDLDLAKSRTNENPVYYIQYAHARICSVFRELEQKGHRYDASVAQANLALLTNEHEQTLLGLLAQYPETLENAAINYEPHHIPQFLRELAHGFHTYYNAHKFLVDDAGLRNARLHLNLAVRQVLQNGLELIGVSAPEAM